MTQATTGADAPSKSTPATSRIQSIDIVRGAVMILMAIDHVRVYSGVPAGGTPASVFFTRWVTHFCAPTFVFLAGTSAFLYGRKLSGGALARHLLVRGIMLVALELTLIRFTWTFNLAYSQFVLAGVIWMLGWCMVLLAGLVQLPARVIGWIGLAIVLFQQVFHALPHVLPQRVQASIGWLWEFVYPAGYEPWQAIAILYVIVPWIGVMASGYGFGLIVAREPEERRRLCLWIGCIATALFLAIGCTLVFLNPPNGNAPPALFRLLNQQKYPASQLFLLMTLGPAIAFLALTDRTKGWFSRVLATFGRVPMFYYLLHIPTIHVAALIVNYLREGAIHQEWYGSAPFAQVPAEHRWGLPLLYLVFFLVVTALYLLCRWFDGLKARRRDGFLKYI
jgi:uncharacterized membrane protein